MVNIRLCGNTIILLLKNIVNKFVKYLYNVANDVIQESIENNSLTIEIVHISQNSIQKEQKDFSL